MKIWVVLGACGEYSDHRNWLVCAYSDQILAERHADRAAEWSEREYAKEHEEDDYTAVPGPYDPSMQMSYTGADYVALEVEMRDELPEVKP